MGSEGSGRRCLGKITSRRGQEATGKEIREENLGSQGEGGRCRKKFKVIKDVYKFRRRLLSRATQCFSTDSNRIDYY